MARPVKERLGRRDLTLEERYGRGRRPLELARNRAANQALLAVADRRWNDAGEALEKATRLDRELEELGDG